MLDTLDTLDMLDMLNTLDMLDILRDASSSVLHDPNARSCTVWYSLQTGWLWYGFLCSLLFRSYWQNLKELQNIDNKTKEVKKWLLLNFCLHTARNL